jgi:hypothetical protein
MKTPGTTGSLWWWNPCWVLVLPLLVVAWAAWVIPETDYQSYWRMPKFFTVEDFQLCLAVAAAFALGAMVAVAVDRAMLRPRLRISTSGEVAPGWQLLLLWFHIGVAVTSAAYFLWFALILRETGPGILVGVLRLEQGSIFELIRLRKDAAITGVTSFTQTGIGTWLVGVFLAHHLGWRRVRWPMLLLLGLTFVRAVFLAERLALIEMLLPGFLLWLRLGVVARSSAARRKLLQLVPVLGIVVLYALFTASEYFRSWGYYAEQGETSLLRFSLVRLSGYYVTALNNGALLWHGMGELYFPYATLEWLWRFPLLGRPLRNLLGGSDDPAELAAILVAEDGNPEFNNPTGIFVVFTDLGVPAGLVFWAVFGGVVMLLHRAFRRGSLAGLFLYPFLFMGLTDQVRIFYLTTGRTFAAWAFLLVAWMIARKELQMAVWFSVRGRTTPPASVPPGSPTVPP